MDQVSDQALSIVEYLRLALKEDQGKGDHTSLSTIDETAKGKAIVRVKEEGIIAGLVVADQVLNLVDDRFIVKVLTGDGDAVSPGQVVMEIEGFTRSLLLAERLLLNCMQRMSGIASLTRKYVNAVEGTGTEILDTRKTTPNFRIFEKWAVRLGGGTNHRSGLYDMILIKDNHVDACGGIKNAVDRARTYLKRTGLSIPIEIETRSLDEVRQVLDSEPVDRIMLDNFDIPKLKEAIHLIRGRMITEASGGIVLENVRHYAESGVNYVSIGALTHSYKSLDISMKLVS